MMKMIKNNLGLANRLPMLPMLPKSLTNSRTNLIKENLIMNLVSNETNKQVKYVHLVNIVNTSGSVQAQSKIGYIFLYPHYTHNIYSLLYYFDSKYREVDNVDNVDKSINIYVEIEAFSEKIMLTLFNSYVDNVDKLLIEMNLVRDEIIMNVVKETNSDIEYQKIIFIRLDESSIFHHNSIKITLGDALGCYRDDCDDDSRSFLILNQEVNSK